MNVFRWFLLAFLGALALTACPSAITTPPGSLQIGVSGLPKGVNADLSVSGPNGFSQALSGSNTLTNLAPGSYAVTARAVTAGGSSYTASVTGSPASVTAGGTVISSVTYAAMTPPTPPTPPASPTPPTPPTTTGALQVDVSFISGNAIPNITVTGPGGFSQTLTGPMTLTNLTPGSYAVTAAAVTSNGFTYLAWVSASPIAVSAGATAKASVTYNPQVGSLQINITGLPNGVKTSLTVHGPNGLTDVLSPVLGSVGDELPVGSYSITATPVRLVGSVVDLIFESAGVSAANVTAGATTTVTVSYAPRPGATALWLPKATGSVVAYAARLLGFGGNSFVLPSLSLNGAAGGGNASVSFDAAGNLWALNSTTNTLSRFDAAQLGSSGTPTPAVTISSSAGSLDRPASLAFDRRGNLWIANLGNDTIVMFTASQLAQSGSPTPGVVISPNPSRLLPRLHGVASLAFDGSGNLWVLNASTPETLARLSPDQLTQSGQPIPGVTINTGLSAGSNIAFDAARNLWVTDSGANTVLKYAAAQLAQSGGPSPAATIRTMNGSLANPAGLAFDSSGNLWVANTGNNTLVEFTVDQLPATPSADSPEAASTISNVSNLASGSIAFNPAPLNLPLSH